MAVVHYSKAMQSQMLVQPNKENRCCNTTRVDISPSRKSTHLHNHNQHMVLSNTTLSETETGRHGQIEVDNDTMLFIDDDVDVRSLESVTCQHHCVPRPPCLWLVLGLESFCLLLLIIAMLNWSDKSRDKYLR